MADRFYTLLDIADRLHIPGKDRVRTVRRLFRRLEIPFLQRCRGRDLVTECQFAALIEAMTCSPYENAASVSTSVARSVSVERPASSKSIARDALGERMLRRTDRVLKTNSGTKSFTVQEGGRTG
jgi:hypothetical protein